jgi:ElaB/YqjD/DUF883 family membrane-anchored ribosome-binding protein
MSNEEKNRAEAEKPGNEAESLQEDVESLLKETKDRQQEFTTIREQTLCSRVQSLQEDVKSLLKETKDRQQQFPRIREPATESIRVAESQLRNKITWYVVFAFLLVVGFSAFLMLAHATGLFVYYRTTLNVSPLETKDLLDDIIHITQGVLLPIVTLVLGYYFGQGGGQGTGRT